MVSPERARSRMVAALRRSGRVRTAAVADALEAVPRHLFLPGVPVDEAYADEAVAIKFAQGVAVSSASQPSMMAIMLEQLDLQPGHRVLEIGAGTGYNAALMSRLVGAAGTVTSVDIDADLVARARENLRNAGASGVELLTGDGALGHPAGAPYDRIVLTVGSWDVRPEWVAQLAAGGRLLLPLAVRGSQLSVALDLGTDGVLRSHSVRSCAFIRLRGIGAGPATRIALDPPGLTIQIAEDAVLSPAAISAALAAPGPVRPAGVEVGGADLWDGLGLWLAVADSGIIRLLATGDAAHTALGRHLLPVGPDRGTVALAGPDGGLAALVIEPPAPPPGDRHGVGRSGVQAFGPDGPRLAARLARLLGEWVDGGRPTAATLRIRAVPRTPEPPAAGPGTTVIGKELSWLLVSWAVPR